MKRALTLLLAAGLSGLWLSSASGEVIELKTGERIEGLLKEAGAATVVVDVAGQLVILDSGRVRAIYFETPPAASARPLPGEALQAVKALWPAVTGDGRRAEHSAPNRELRSTIDRYVAGGSGLTPPVADPVADAIRYYLLAESAWSNLSPTARTVWLRRDDLLDRCQAYREFARAMQAKGDAYYAERTRSYVVISDTVLPVLWTCASARIAEAEKLFAGRAR